MSEKLAKKRLEKVNVSTNGNTDNTWNIVIRNVHDADLYYVEMEVLNIFGKRKVGKGYTKKQAEKELREMRALPDYKNMKFFKEPIPRKKRKKKPEIPTATCPLRPNY